jgi:DNA replication protein DnaC
MDPVYEIKKLQKICDTCVKCSGEGYIFTTKDDYIYMDPCSCLKETEKKIKYVEANIPPQYWDWDFRRLTKLFKHENAEAYKFLKMYLKNLGKNIDKGNSFWLSSSPGLAKSSIISYIISESIKLGRIAYYIPAHKIHDLKFDAMRQENNARELLQFIEDEVEILALEELDKIYLKSEDSFNNQAFYQFLCMLYDSKKTILISSNKSKDIVFKSFPSYIQDRLDTIDYIEISGKVSGRKIK